MKELSNKLSNKKLSKKKWLVIIGAVCCILIGIWIYFLQKPSNIIEYKEFLVEKGHIDINVIATGVVQPQNKLEIKLPISGRVEQVLVKEGDLVRRGQVLAWMSSTERAALLDAARSKGELEYKTWEEIYKATPLMAPINGMIIFRNVEPGQSFTAQDSVFVMSDRLIIKAQVDETDIAEIKLQLPARVVLDAYPKDSFDAQVDQVAFDAKTVNNVTTYVVEVLPKNPPPYLRSGMTSNVTFFVQSKKDILVVPNEALKVKEGNYYLLKNQEGTLRQKIIEQPVQVGITDGKLTEIIDGIKEGEEFLIIKKKMFSNKSSGNPFAPMAPRRGGGGGSSGGSSGGSGGGSSGGSGGGGGPH